MSSTAPPAPGKEKGIVISKETETILKGGYFAVRAGLRVLPILACSASCAGLTLLSYIKGEGLVDSLGLSPDNQDGRNEPTPITTPALPTQTPEITIVTATPANSPTATETSTDIGAAAAEPAQETRPTLISDEDPLVAFLGGMITASLENGVPISKLQVEDPQSGTSGPLEKNLQTLLNDTEKQSKLPDEAKVTIKAIVLTLAQMTGNPATDEPLKNQIWQLLVELGETCGDQCTDLINDLSNYLRPGAGQEEPMANNQSASAPENILPSTIPPVPVTERPAPTATAAVTARPTATATSQPTLDIFATAQNVQDNIRKTAQAEVTAAANATVDAYQKEATAAANAAANATVDAYQKEATQIVKTATARSESTPPTATATTKKFEAAQTPTATATQTKKPAATEIPSPTPTLSSQAEKPFWENLWKNLLGGGESPDAGSRGFD